jgi:hypothetical protein
LRPVGETFLGAPFPPSGTASASVRINSIKVQAFRELSLELSSFAPNSLYYFSLGFGIELLYCMNLGPWSEWIKKHPFKSIEDHRLAADSGPDF